MVKPMRSRPRPTRARLAPDARRTEIVETAERLFRTRSYADLGIADVAREAGITQGLVYHYFPTKEAVFAAACEVRAQDLLRYCRPDPTLSYPEQVERGVRGYLDFVEEHSIAYRNLFTGPTAGEAEIQAVCEATRQALVDSFVSALGLEAASCPATRLSLRGYIGYCEGLVLAWLPERTVPRATLERMLAAVILTALGIGLTSERKPPLAAEALAGLAAAYRRHFALP